MKGLREHETAKMLAYYAVLVGIGLMVGALGPTLSLLGQHTGSSLQQVSLILALRPLGYISGALWSGRLSDRRAGHPVVGGAALLAAVTLALIPLAGSLGLLGACVLASGVAQGLMDVGSTTLLGWVFHGRLGPYLVGLHFSFGFGAFIAPLVCAQALAGGGGLPAAYWPLAAFLLLPAGMLFWLPSPQRARPKDGAVAPPLDRRLAALIVLFCFLYGGLESGFGVWVYQYALALKVADLGQAALLSSLFWGLLGLGRLLGIPLLAWVSPATVIRAVLPLSLLCFGAVLLWPDQPASLWVGTGGFGLFMACVFPSLVVEAVQLLGRGHSLSGKATSIFFLGASTGSMTLPWLMGQAFEPWGPRRALALGLLNLVGMIVVFQLLQARGRRLAVNPEVR